MLQAEDKREPRADLPRWLLQPSLAAARKLVHLSSPAAAAAESRHPSAIQRPRGPADGRQWLRPEHRTRNYLAFSAGPVIERRGNVAHRAGPRPAGHVRTPSVPRHSRKALPLSAATRVFAALPDLLTDPLFKKCTATSHRACNRGPAAATSPTLCPGTQGRLPSLRFPSLSRIHDALRVAALDTRLSLALRAPFTVQWFATRSTMVIMYDKRSTFTLINNIRKLLNDKSRVNSAS